MPNTFRCEECGCAPDARDYNYCYYCSKDLCPACLRDGECYQSADPGKHWPAAERDEKE